MEQKNKLYVGNLNNQASESDLRDMFSEFGEISEVNLITEGDRSKGFGFVTFADESSAAAAAEAMNGKEVGGRELVVNVARPKGER
jgi:cold-inducible RNA-binding protein